MELILRCSTTTRKETVQRDFLWYDSDQKKLVSSRAGGMQFVFDAEKRKLVPKFVDHSEEMLRNNYPELSQWVKANTEKYDIVIMEDVPRHFMSIEIAAGHFEEIVRELYQKKILFDFDEIELKTEISGKYKWSK